MRVVFGVAVLVLVSTCQAPPAEITDADRAAIDALVSEYQATALAGDWDVWTALWTEDAVYMVPAMPVLEGRGAIRASMDAFPAPPSELGVSITALDGAGGWAWVRGTFRMTMPAIEDMPEMTEVGKFLWVLEKQADGGWLIDSEAYNSDLPPLMPPEEG
jgi:uncharacterized protein (TIGR02246 family)